MTTTPAARPAEPRFCKDCRHMRVGAVTAVCDRPRPPRFNLVYGGEMAPLHETCSDERYGGDVEHGCGSIARFFEPKEGA